MKKKKILKNVEIEEGDIFIRVPSETSLEAKKDLLEITESVIEAQIAIERFKQHRKEEEARRMEAKRGAKEIHAAVNNMLSELPRDIKVRIRKEPEQVPKPTPEKKAPVHHRIVIPKSELKIRPTKLSDLQKELHNIKQKIGTI